MRFLFYQFLRRGWTRAPRLGSRSRPMGMRGSANEGQEHEGKSQQKVALKGAATRRGRHPELREDWRPRLAAAPLVKLSHKLRLTKHQPSLFPQLLAVLAYHYA